jgi:hypothetical protein
MGNKGFLSTFITILAATLVFYGFSTVGALAFSNSSSKNFGDETYVGPFDISGQKEQAIKEKLASEFAALQGDFVVNLTYQDVTVELPSEAVTLDIDKTVDQSNSGKENPIVATVSIDGLRTVLTQQFPSIDFTDDSIQSIAFGVEQELGTGIMPLNVHITDYSDFTETEIATSSIVVQEISTSFHNLIVALNGTELAPFATFSLVDFIRNNEVGHVSDDELTVLSSVLYTTILQTNFIVDERNIGTTLAPFAEPGFEAAINEQLGLDFIFTNPNKSVFTLHIESADETIHSSITGMALLYSYQSYIGQIESFEPKTVQHFSAFVPYGQVSVADEGRKGMEVNVHRTITYEGAVVMDEMISSDFYAPLPKIEILPLKKDTSGSTGNVNEGLNKGNTGSETVDSQGNQLPSDSSGSVDSSNGTNYQDERNPSKVQGEGDTEEEKEAIQYDKGGNIISKR